MCGRLVEEGERERERGGVFGSLQLIRFRSFMGYLLSDKFRILNLGVKV